MNVSNNNSKMQLPNTLVYGINPVGLPPAQAGQISHIIWDEMHKSISSEYLKTEPEMIVVAQTRCGDQNCYVGCATLRRDKDDKTKWYFECFCVSEKFRKRGIGRDIINTAFDLIPPTHTLFLHIDKHIVKGSKILRHEVLQKYYEKHGFVRTYENDVEIEMKFIKENDLL